MKILLLGFLLFLPVPFIVAARSGAPVPKTALSHQTNAKVLVDGALNPELISDYRAYSLLFRFISKNREGRERNAIRAYIRQIFRDGSCPDCSVDLAAVEKQIDSLIATGEEFSASAQPLDVRIKELHDQRLSDGPDTEADQIRREKELICDAAIGSLTNRVGPTAADRVRLHIEGMKRKMKIVQ
jgi:hypothetical protein